MDHPEWKKLVENPEREIPESIQKGDTSMLDQLCTAIHDDFFRGALIQVLEKNT